MPQAALTNSPVSGKTSLGGIQGKMALAIAGECVHANISMMAVASELMSWKCDVFSNESETIAFIRNCLENYDSALHNTIEDDRTYPKLKAEISLFISNLLSGKRIG